MAQTPSSDVNGRPAGLVLATACGTQRHIIHVGTSSSMELILSQLNPFHIFIPHFFKVHFIFPNLTIILYFRPPS